MVRTRDGPVQDTVAQTNLPGTAAFLSAAAGTIATGAGSPGAPESSEPGGRGCALVGGFWACEPVPSNVSAGLPARVR